APVQIGNTNQYDVPIFIQLPASQPSASTTITLTITGLSYTGATSGGTQPGDTHDLNRTNGDMNNNRTYIDVAFAGSIDQLIDSRTINNDDFTLGGFGAGASGSIQTLYAIDLHNGTWRYIVQGNFLPGTVEVRFIQDRWSEYARGPPVVIPTTPNAGFNRQFTLTFSVVG